jgi:hypothetical protein
MSVTAQFGVLETAGVTRRSWRDGAFLAVVSVLALFGFTWPMFVPALPAGLQSAAPVLAILLTVLLAVAALFALNTGISGARTVALLGTLTAVGVAARLLGLGFGGVELVFVVLIIAGRVLGPTFGFALGALVMLTSTMLSGMIGPWLPFQMFAAGWVGVGAGLLPGRTSVILTRGRVAEISLLSAYGIVSAYAYGLLLNLWFWPFAIGGETSLSFDASAPLAQNLARFFTYSLATSTLTWDTVRALTTVIGLAVLGFPLLAALRRTRR